jgi:hypothetical protein
VPAGAADIAAVEAAKERPTMSMQKPPHRVGKKWFSTSMVKEQAPWHRITQGCHRSAAGVGCTAAARPDKGGVEEVRRELIRQLVS